MKTEVKHNYVPRRYFTPFHARNQRFAVLVVHRRGGKTVAVVNDLVVRAMRTKKKNWFGAYIGPFFGQSKQIAWAYLKAAVSNLPAGIAQIHESETSISFVNGAKIRIFGADNSDALRGLYFDYVVLDEVAQIPRRVWTEVIRPALADRQGSVVFMGTPKGKNFFYELAERARLSNGKWFYLRATIEDTQILPEKEIADIKEDLDEAEWSQEFMCNFESALRGSYYGKQMADLQARGGLCKVAYDTSEKVFAAMDVGHGDSTAIWFWQVINGRFRIFDYFQSVGLDAAETVDILELKPYAYESIWLPHDAFHQTWTSKKSGFDTFVEAGLPARRVPKPDQGNRVYHGIDATRKVLRTYPIEIDIEHCAEGIECLRNYSRKFDVEKKVYSDTPQHDQWSHGADGFRYLALAINPADIGRSIERAKQRAAKATQVNNKPTSMFNTYTFGDAIREHQQKIEAGRRNANKLRY